MKFTTKSTGYDWKSSTTEERKEYAVLISSKMKSFNHEATEDFILQALNSFFNSDEEFLLSQGVNEIMTMAVIANKGLQENELPQKSS